MKSMIAATAAYAIFIKKSSIFAINSISIINSKNQMINETFTSVISTKVSVISTKLISTRINESISTSINSLFEHVLFNDIRIYDIESITSEIITTMYKYLNI